VSADVALSGKSPYLGGAWVTDEVFFGLE